jgi:hypothetical protein
MAFLSLLLSLVHCKAPLDRRRAGVLPPSGHGKAPLDRLRAPEKVWGRLFLWHYGWESLDAHRGRPNERPLRRRGSPVGSRGIEAANTCRGQVRHKRSGAWGYAANTHQRRALRCAKANGTLAQVLVWYPQRLRETSE